LLQGLGLISARFAFPQVRDKGQDGFRPLVRHHQKSTIVRTRNRWQAPASVAHMCPEMLDHRLQLSDAIEDLPEESCCVRELTARFHGGPIPAKFALAEVGGRIVCLDFEERDAGPAPAVSRAAAGHQPGN